MHRNNHHSLRLVSLELCTTNHQSLSTRPITWTPLGDVTPKASSIIALSWHCLVLSCPSSTTLPIDLHSTRLASPPVESGYCEFQKHPRLHQSAPYGPTTQNALEITASLTPHHASQSRHPSKGRYHHWPASEDSVSR